MSSGKGRSSLIKEKKIVKKISIKTIYKMSSEATVANKS